jgi:hypothetical protein
MREPDGPVKIGITHVANIAGCKSLWTIEGRRQAIQSASGRRMVVLHHEAGSRRLERETHRRFARLRLLGEWFRPEPELLEYIDQLRGR